MKLLVKVGHSTLMNMEIDFSEAVSLKREAGLQRHHMACRIWKGRFAPIHSIRVAVIGMS